MTSSPSLTVVPEWLLVTGQPGSGKTTAVKKIVTFLQAHGKECRGFYTDEVLDPKTKSRIGFDVVTVPDGKRGVLSRKAGFGLQTKHKTGQYFVDVASFEAIALPSLAKSKTKLPTKSPTSPAIKRRKINGRKDTSGNSSQNDSNLEDDCILVLDEIGRMELHSTAFSDRVRELLELKSPTTSSSTTTSNNRLVGAITAPIYGHRVPFCDEVASTSGVVVQKLTRKTRDDVFEGLLRSIEERAWVKYNEDSP